MFDNEITKIESPPFITSLENEHRGDYAPRDHTLSSIASATNDSHDDCFSAQTFEAAVTTLLLPSSAQAVRSSRYLS